MLNVVVLKQFLDATPMSQKDIASKLEMAESTFSLKATGKRKFTIEEALDLAELLNLQYCDFKEVWGNGFENIE